MITHDYALAAAEIGSAAYSTMLAHFEDMAACGGTHSAGYTSQNAVVAVIGKPSEQYIIQ